MSNNTCHQYKHLTLDTIVISVNLYLICHVQKVIDIITELRDDVGLDRLI